MFLTLATGSFFLSLYMLLMQYRVFLMQSQPLIQGPAAPPALYVPQPLEFEWSQTETHTFEPLPMNALVLAKPLPISYDYRNRWLMVMAIPIVTGLVAAPILIRRCVHRLKLAKPGDYLSMDWQMPSAAAVLPVDAKSD